MNEQDIDQKYLDEVKSKYDNLANNCYSDSLAQFKKEKKNMAKL